MSFENDDIEYEPWRTVEYGNLALVRAVKKRPCLYNNTIPEYSQKDVTRAAWEEIAEEFGCSVEDCKKKWKGLRTVYSREIYLVQAKKKRKPYYLSKHMDFLHPFLHSQPIHTYRTLIKNLNRKVYDYSFEIPSLNDSAEFSEAMTGSMENSGEVIDNIEISNDDNNIETASNNSDDISLEFGNAMNASYNIESSECASDSACKSAAQPIIIQCVKANEDPKTNNYCQINGENPRRQFISSLLPEIEEMTEKQFRTFKRRVFPMIDDVLLNS